MNENEELLFKTLTKQYYERFGECFSVDMMCPLSGKEAIKAMQTSIKTGKPYKQKISYEIDPNADY